MMYDALVTGSGSSNDTVTVTNLTYPICVLSSSDVDGEGKVRVERGERSSSRENLAGLSSDEEKY
jgi:hypothetical protein